MKTPARHTVTAARPYDAAGSRRRRSDVYRSSGGLDRNFWDETPTPGGTPNAANTRAYTQSYQYDKLGNIQQLAHTATGNSYNRHYHYASGNNILEQIDNGGSPANVYGTFAYDACGNQVQQNTERFLEWDAADQLRFFKTDGGGGPSKEAHYLYAGGQRIKKFVRTGNDLEITVYIDGVYEHRYKAVAAGSTSLDLQDQINYHVMDGRSRIATVRTGDAWGDSTPDISYNLEDHLGTSGTRIEASGTPIDHEEYYPFGDSSLRTFSKKRYRYVGKERDNESGLYYYGARYYMAWVGRFISVDPLAHKYTYLTPYNYAGNKPIGDLDIDGMQSKGDTPDSGNNKKPNIVHKKSGARIPGGQIEVDNLPKDPSDGQTVTYEYPEGDETKSVYTYNSESDSWNKILFDKNYGAPIDGFIPIPRTKDKNLGESGNNNIENNIPNLLPADKNVNPIIPTGENRKNDGPIVSPSESGILSDKSSEQPSVIDKAKELYNKNESEIKGTRESAGIIADIVEESAKSAKNQPDKYKSSRPQDSAKNVEKANKFLNKLETRARRIGKILKILDVSEMFARANSWFKDESIPLGELINTIWNIGVELVSKTPTPLGLFVRFGDFILGASGAKEKLFKELNHYRYSW